MPGLFLGISDNAVKENRNLARWFEDPVIVFRKFLTALPQIDAFIAEISIRVACAADYLVEILPWPHHREGRRYRGGNCGGHGKL
jgi:hypothetical protein